MKPTEYPNLCYVVSHYLHQDWDSDADSPAAAIQKGWAELPSRMRRGLCDEIGRLTSSSSSDEDLWSFLRELGSNYDARSDGVGARSWLREVATLIGCEESHPL